MDDYSDDFIKSIASSDLSKLGQDYAINNLDDLIDKALNNSKLAEHIPFLKVLKAGYEDAKAARHRKYVRVIFKFWFQVGKVSEEAKAKYRAKLEADPEEVKKTGEAVWEILDSISSSEKAPMIGKVFEAYMADEISPAQVMYLSEMIDKAYLADLKNIEANARHNRENLINIGFYEPVNYKKVIDDEVAVTMKGITPNTKTMQETPMTDEGRLLARILKSY